MSTSDKIHDILGNQIIKGSKTWEKLERVVTLGRERLGLDPDSKTREIKSLANRLWRVASYYSPAKQDQETWPRNLKKHLTDIIGNNRVTIRMWQELPEDIRSAVDNRAGKFGYSPPIMSNEARQKTAEAIRKELRKELGTNSPLKSKNDLVSQLLKEELRDQFDADKTILELGIITKCLEDIRQTHPPKTKEMTYAKRFILEANKIIQELKRLCDNPETLSDSERAPICEKLRTLSRDNFIIDCLRELGDERDDETIRRYISRVLQSCR